MQIEVLKVAQEKSKSILMTSRKNQNFRYALRCPQEVPNFFSMSSKSSPSCPTVLSKLFPRCLKVVPKVSQTCPKDFAKLSQRGWLLSLSQSKQGGASWFWHLGASDSLETFTRLGRQSKNQNGNLRCHFFTPLFFFCN